MTPLRILKAKTSYQAGGTLSSSSRMHCSSILLLLGSKIQIKLQIQIEIEIQIQMKIHVYRYSCLILEGRTVLDPLKRLS